MANRVRDLARLANANPYGAIVIAYYDDGAETKMPTAFDHFGDSRNVNYALI